jgi:hypothetical protein
MISTSSLRAYVSLACFLLLHCLTVPSKAQTPGPDDSPFVIPDVAVPIEGFGKKLTEACEALEVLFAGLPKPATMQPAGARVPAATLSDARSGAAVALATVGGNLMAACEDLRKESGDLSPHLEFLRSLRSEGGLEELTYRFVQAKAEKPAVKKGVALVWPEADVWQAAAEAGVDENQLQGNASSETLSGLESRVIEGLADFLVTRTKEEAILYLQQRIKDHVCTDDDLKTLLPRICETLSSLDASISLAAIGTALNGAARRDLEALPDNLLKLAAKHDRPHYFVYEPARLAYALFRETADGRNPKDLVIGLHRMAPRSCEAAPVATTDKPTLHCKNAFAMLRLASAMIYAGSANGLDARAYSRSSDGPLLVGTVLDGEAAAMNVGVLRALTPDEVVKAITGVIEVSRLLSSWNQELASLRALEKKEATTPEDRRRRLASAAVQLLRAVGQMKVWVQLLPDQRSKDDVELALQVVQELADLGRDLVAEQYGAALADLRALIVHLRTHELFATSNTKLAAAVEGVGKLAPLIAEIASAQSSKDVATALEAAAAPAGSYTAKYQRSLVALNAFVGGLAGTEVIRTPRDPVTGDRDTGRSGMIAGFAAVGVQVTAPFLARDAGGYWFHVGIMASILDLGALTTQRFDEEVSGTESVDESPNVGVKQVFSPGAYITLGIMQTPLVIGGGFSLAPNLRTVETNDTAGTPQAKEVSAMRYGGFVAMDLTLLPF